MAQCSQYPHNDNLYVSISSSTGDEQPTESGLIHPGEQGSSTFEGGRARLNRAYTENAA